MKHIRKNMEQQLMVVCFLFGLTAFCGFFIPTPAICDKSVADEIISLNVTDQPLGEVLKNISIVADCQFTIDESWEDYSVTASFDQEPLYRGLKLIFRNINNAVIYGSNRTIRIVIYDEGTPSGKATGHRLTIQSSQETIHEPLLINEATAPQPEVEFSEDSGNRENVKEQPEADAGSASEESETNTGNTEIYNDESGEAASEGTTATLETEEKESDSEEQNNLTE